MSSAPTATVVTEHVRAELVAHAPQGIAPGAEVWLGLAIEHAPGWHTYWKNPGDSGLPTTLAWQLPDDAARIRFVWMPEFTGTAAFLHRVVVEGHGRLVSDVLVPRRLFSHGGSRLSRFLQLERGFLYYVDTGLIDQKF